MCGGVLYGICSISARLIVRKVIARAFNDKGLVTHDRKIKKDTYYFLPGQLESGAYGLYCRAP